MVFRFLRRDPARKWPVVAAVPLRLDTAAGTLNGVPLGAPAAALAQFGRPDHRGATHAGEYEYRALGLTVRAYDGRVETYVFRFDDPLRPEFGACALEVLLPRGRALRLSAAVDQAELERALGRPKGSPAEEVEGDEEQLVLFVAGVVDLWAHIAPDGRLNALDVDLSPPAG